MTPLIAVPSRILAEVTELLQYGLTKNCDQSAAALANLQKQSAGYQDLAAVPLSADLLQQMHRTLLVLCITAGSDFPPGEKVVRFARNADHLLDFVSD
ncbi:MULTISPECIES: hypothetical protein [unclassified Streptomyces]|uniref:hypothetical protein n=1 Tax=unclassified Streptomyces TaxID=2593676 RepID=UPI000DBA3E66|nr:MULTISPECIES: hypothetical protein [unclassified Streptomyces]MYT68221.1 hypothetical protein [Streptomyces sp. SID8367]RAJ76853.1 hypothetical protein K377_06021 [Streptomyces sp. PsTaAH-137]